MTHFGTTFGALLAQPLQIRPLHFGPLERQNEGFGVFGVTHFWETPPPDMGPKKGPI